MRPHRLRVTAFGAFGGTVEVNFDDLASAGLFLLHGETGAGKTTLLDAIGFALYGQVPGERAKTKRLRSDHATASAPTEVQLEATVGGRRLRITRRPEQERPKRRGSGTTTEQMKVLLEESDGGSWRAVSTRVGEADDEISRLMGMSAAQFFQVVLLPQGEFSKFLHAEAKNRAELLQKLFGTDRFRAVEEWLAERRRATAREVEEAGQAIKELLARVAQVADVPPPIAETADDDQALPDAAWAAGLAEAAAACAAASEGQVNGFRAALETAQDTRRAAERLAERQQRRQKAQRDQDDLTAQQDQVADLRRELAAAALAAEVAATLAEAERTADALAHACAAEEKARSQAGSPAATAADLRAASQEQAAKAGWLEALRSLARQAEEEDHAADTARAEAAALATRIAAGAEEVSTERQRRLELISQRDQAREAGEKLSGARAEADRYRRAADDADALVRARADARRQEEAYFAARLETADLRDQASRVRMARIDGMRAELAATLVDGAPCPVCGSLDHPELCELRGERVTRDEEEAADAEAAAAADRAELIGAKLAAADILVADLTARLEGSGFTSAVDLATLRAEAARLAARARGLAAEAAKLTAAASRHGELQAALDLLDTGLASAGKCLVEHTEQRESALRQASEADQRSARHRASLLAQFDGQSNLENALSAALEATDALAAAADAADATAHAQTGAQRAKERALQAAADAGFADLDSVRQAQRPPDWRAATDQAIRDHEAAIRAAADLLADPDLDVPLDPPADVAAAMAEVDAARQAHDNAVGARDLARHRAEQLADLAPRLEARMNALNPLAAKAAEARRLADLAAGQGVNTLRMTLSSFVLAARLEEVAAAASERLLAMTSGRYCLVHTDARRGAGRSGLGLLACDAWTGVDRDTSTLSGGETFLASLALALGLADVVTAEAGGTRIEALFVDEGFGSLDEDTLDEVMTVLDGLREGGRMVGIVSHVAELRQRVPAQVRVRKGRAGSHLDVRAPSCSLFFCRTDGAESTGCRAKRWLLGILTRVSTIAVVGVPSSAASYAAGQDLAPMVLRSAGLLEELSAAGLEVRDEGDLPHQVWKPDRDHPLAQNADEAAASLRQLAGRLEPLLARGDFALVLGGNCTIALGVMAALRRLGQGAPGLLYVDRHYDLNTPESTTDGALDWMGLAHALALPGCVDTLTDVFGPRPLLEAHQVAWLGVEPRRATDWEREQADRLGLRMITSEALAGDPAGAAMAALDRLPPGPLAVHLDVDVLDFTDAPLAESTDGRNSGPTLGQAEEALRLAARDPRVRSLSIGELNPTRCAGDPAALPRFASTIVRILAVTTH